MLRQIQDYAVTIQNFILYTALFHQKIGSTQQIKKEKERKTTI